MNKVVLIVRLTRDPELKFSPNTGTAVASFTLAVDKRFKKEGQQTADFIPIVVWGKNAENTCNHMKKGNQVAIAGRIEIRSYEAKDGSRRYVTEIIAEEVQFLGGINKGNLKDGIPGDYFGEDGMNEVDEDAPF